MNVFEKIKEKLEKELTLSQKIMKETSSGVEFDEYYYKAKAYCNVVEIINQIVEKYNNGWVSVKEHLPEELQEVLVWYEYFRYGEYNCMYQTYGIAYHVKGRWAGDVTGRNARCIAWQPLPEPFKAKEVFENKKMTNAERIRKMNDEELAKFLSEVEEAGYNDGSFTPKLENGYHMDILEWLQAESEE